MTGWKWSQSDLKVISKWSQSDLSFYSFIVRYEQYFDDNFECTQSTDEKSKNWF